MQPQPAVENLLTKVRFQRLFLNRSLIRGHRKLDGQQAFQKITKRHFFKDNQVSF